MYEDNGSLEFPTHYIDISDNFTEKMEILNFYKSQIEGAYEFKDLCIAQNRYRGLLMNTQYAEFYSLLGDSKLRGWND